MTMEIAVEPGPVAERMKEIAIGFRVEGHLFSAIGDPSPGSPFVAANELYAWEKASDWCHEYLASAIESALMWAEFSAPLEFDESHRVRIRPRPVFGLARSCLESASQAAWIMTSDSPHELTARHLRLMHSDFDEQRKAYRLQGARVEQADRQIERFLSRVDSAFDRGKLEARIAYLDTIRSAAKAMGLDPDAVEYLWRLASGSTHGKRWAALEINEVVLGEEYEPGQHRVVRTPKPEMLLEVLEAAYQFIRFGVAVFAARSGASYAPLRQAALLAVAREMPVPADREGARQALIDRFTQ
jgi:hypothetical protein